MRLSPRGRPLPLPVSALLLALTAATATAQQRSAPSALAQPAAFAGLEYRLLGPFAGGRLTRVAGIPGDPFTYYIAASSGGVWKSVDGGHEWKPIFDDQPTSSIGAIAVAPSDPNVVYVGAGEANVRGNTAPGDGIYRSLDAGRTWEHVWKQEGQIGQVAVDPRDARVAFAAVLGHAFGPNPERGVYRTTDGGTSWVQVLKKDASTGASAVALDPSNPNVVFAGLWQMRRTPWSMTSGGPGSGLYVSRDGGDSWTQLTGHGLPGGTWGKVGVAVAPSDGNRVYAIIEADDGGLFRSDDGGDTWDRVNDSHMLTQRAWYYATLTIDPTNPDRVWFPQVPLVRTIDGGKTVEIVDAPHGDHHDVWIDPENAKRMIDGHDGGVAISTDGGETWMSPPLPLGQFYHIATDSRNPYRVQGAMQDLGTAQAPNNTLRAGGITDADWRDVGGGEAGFVVSDPQDPDVVYAGEYLGIITRHDERTGESRNVSAYPENPSGHGDVDADYRFQWTAPIAASPNEPGVIYHGAQVLFRSADGGQTWTRISPDLTRNDTTKQRWTGGPITGDNTGVEYYSTIFAIAESPMEQGLIWVGSDDGLVHVTRDGGQHWTDVTKGMKGIPEWGTIDMIEPSPFDAATAYVVVDAHRLDDMTPYLFRTTDYGKSWQRMDAGLPRHTYLHAVRADPEKPGQLYVGTEHGVAMSPDDGETWVGLDLNLPTVAVHDLAVKDNDLVLGTHGRGVWILDDLTPLRQWGDAIAAKPLALFPPVTTTAWRYRYTWADGPTGANPPAGAIVNYWLRAKPAGELKLEVLDSAGAVIRTLSSVAKPLDHYSEYEKQPEPELSADSAEVQRAVWDLRLEGAKRIPGAMIDTGDPADAPSAPSGRYTLRLSADGDTATAPLVVVPDPRLRVPDEDRAAQLAFALELRSALNRLADGVARLRSVRGQLVARDSALADRPDAAELRARSESLVAKLDSLARRMYSPEAEVTYDILAKGSRFYSRLTPLYMWAAEGDGAPTQGMREVWAAQEEELQGYLDELDSLLATDLAEINTMADRLGIPYVVTTASKPVT